MVAFVIRHHGDKIPSCEELNKTLHPNLISNLTDSSTGDGIVRLTTLDTSGGSLDSTNSSELDELTNGFTEYSGKQWLFNNSEIYNKANHTILFLFTKSKYFYSTFNSIVPWGT